jgi:hypothetical protein
MGSSTSQLRDAVKRRFYPFAEGRGFTRAKINHPHFAVFHRKNGEILQIFDIQWDKMGKPRLVLNFGEAPSTGDAVTIDYSRRGRLQRKRGPFLRNWFQINKTLIDALLSMTRAYRSDEVVDQLIEYFPEVEAWWESKHEGPHIYIAG